MTQPVKEIRRRWSLHQDRLLVGGLRHRRACVAQAWLTPEQAYADAIAALRAKEASIRDAVSDAFGMPELSTEERELLVEHIKTLDRVLGTIPSLAALKLQRLPIGDESGEVLRRPIKPFEKGPGEVLLRLDWSIRVQITCDLEFQLGGKVERPVTAKQAVEMAKPIDDGFEARVDAYKKWRVAPFHSPVSVVRREVMAIWRFLILPPSTTGPQMLERLDELKAAVAASASGKPDDRCGVVTDDERHAAMARKHGYLAFVPPL